MMFSYLRSSIVSSLVLFTVANDMVVDPPSEVNHGQLMVDWLRSRGGSFSSKLEIRRTNPADPTSHFAMFSSEDIRPREVLIQVPRDLLISPDEEVEEKSQLQCETINILLIEMRKVMDGKESAHGPYVKYLLSQPMGQLPSTWSQSGKDLLTDILGKSEEDDEEISTILPPHSPVGWLENDWVEDCNGSSDPFEMNAAALLLMRSWDDLLIPVFDYMSHRNGKWLNTDSSSVHENTPVKVFASRMIEAGEEIYTSYNMCRDCGGRVTSYGTPEMLRDYGFVEDYPQRWIFHNEELGYEIDEAVDDEGIPNGELELTKWILEKPDITDLVWLTDMLEMQKDTAEMYLSDQKDIPQKEWDVIVKYQRALVTAIEIGIHKMKDMGLFIDSAASEL